MCISDTVSYPEVCVGLKIKLKQWVALQLSTVGLILAQIKSGFYIFRSSTGSNLLFFCLCVWLLVE